MNNIIFICFGVFLSVGSVFAQSSASAVEQVYKNHCGEISLVARISSALVQAKLENDACDRDVILKNVRADLDRNYQNDGDSIVSDLTFRNQLLWRETRMSELFSKGENQSLNHHQRELIPSQFSEMRAPEGENSVISKTLPGFRVLTPSR